MASICLTPIRMARGNSLPRAMSLLELTVVLVIVALLATAGISRFGTETLATGGAEGFVRKLALSLNHARRATIATGDNHYLQLSPSTAGVTSFALYRRAVSGNVQVDATCSVPTGVTVTASAAQLEFDFDGAALAGYTVTVSSSARSWSVAVVALTGTVRVTETTP
jgi:prepilin-type N-terminal cleavage/methylation domain-containing protein